MRALGRGEKLLRLDSCGSRLLMLRLKLEPLICFIRMLVIENLIRKI